MSDYQSLNDKLAEFFERHSNVWIDGVRLEAVAGRYAWRSRCSDLRKRGMEIRNKQERFTDAEGRRWTISSYMYVPTPDVAGDDFRLVPEIQEARCGN